MGHHHRVSRPGYHDGLSVIMAAGNCGGYDPARNIVVGRQAHSLIECRDGFCVSVQAGHGPFCMPRVSTIPIPEDLSVLYPIPEDFSVLYPSMYQAPFGYRGPFFSAEVAYPTARPEPWATWRKFADDEDNWFGLYQYVPERVIRRLLDDHGGFLRFAKTFPLVQIPQIRCPVCGKRSTHPMDIASGYCGECHQWTSDPSAGASFPTLEV